MRPMQNLLALILASASLIAQHCFTPLHWLHIVLRQVWKEQHRRLIKYFSSASESVCLLIFWTCDNFMDTTFKRNNNTGWTQNARVTKKYLEFQVTAVQLPNRANNQIGTDASQSETLNWKVYFQLVVLPRHDVWLRCFMQLNVRLDHILSFALQVREDQNRFPVMRAESAHLSSELDAISSS